MGRIQVSINRDAQRDHRIMMRNPGIPLSVGGNSKGRGCAVMVGTRALNGARFYAKKSLTLYGCMNFIKMVQVYGIDASIPVYHDGKYGEAFY